MAVGDCAQAFLQAPLLEKSDVWVTPPPEAEVQPGRAWRLLKTLPGLKGGPAAWGHHATKVKEERYGLIQSARDPCVHSNVRERMWTMRHMDDYVIVGPPAKVSEMTEGWMLERTINGFRLQDPGLANSTRKCATAGVKDRVVDETPMEREEHSYFRAQVGRLLFLSVLFAIRSGTACKTCLGTNCLRSHCFEARHSIPVGNTRDEAGTFPEGTTGALGDGRC